MPLRLIIEDDEGSTTIVPLASDAITIGRREGNTIQLTERNVSRQHARLSPEGERWAIEDLGSYNGIRVNGESIAGRKSLKEGDVVQIGDYHLAITEDPEKRTLSYEPREEEAANEEPLLASSSILPRLSKEELQAILPEEAAAGTAGEQEDDGAPVAVPLAPPSAGEHILRGDAVPDEDRDDEGAAPPRKGLGVFVGGGVILGLCIAGLLAWRSGTDAGAENGQVVDAAPAVAVQNEPTPPRPVQPDPPPVDAVPTVAPDVGVPAEAQDLADETGGGPAPEDARSAEESTGGEPRDERPSGMRTPEGRRSAAPSRATKTPTASDATGRRSKTQSSSSKPAVATKTEPAPPASPSVPKDPAPTAEESAPEELKADADALLSQARMAQFKNPSEAYELAKSAYAVRRSEGALVVMASAACRMGDAAKARRAIARLQGDAKEKMASACRNQGVTF